jgi:hypothetical protein
MVVLFIILEICRVCRCEATPDQPLFYPCRCSGSIKYVHEDCLKEWLLHSRKRHCELCKHPFTFTRVYREDMPETIPFPLFVRRASMRLLKSLVFALRVLLAGVVWLIILPYATVWALRGLLWSGESVALGLSGTQLPEHIIRAREQEQAARLANGTFDGPGGFWKAMFRAAIYGVIHNQTDTSIGSSENTVPVHSLAIEERQLVLAVTRFFADCFEGQIIACLVVVVFVAGFLLREWILQNTRPPELQAPMDEVLPPVPAPAPAPMPGPAQWVDAEQPRNEPPNLPLPNTPPTARPSTPRTSQDSRRRISSQARGRKTSRRSVRHAGADKDAQIRQRSKRSHHRHITYARLRWNPHPGAKELQDVVKALRNRSHIRIDRSIHETVLMTMTRTMAHFDETGTSKQHVSRTRAGKQPACEREQAHLTVMVCWPKGSTQSKSSVEPRSKKTLNRRADGFLSRGLFVESGEQSIEFTWPRYRRMVFGKTWAARIQWSVARRSPHRVKYPAKCYRCKKYCLQSLNNRSRRHGWEMSLYPHHLTLSDKQIKALNSIKPKQELKLEDYLAQILRDAQEATYQTPSAEAMDESPRVVLAQASEQQLHEHMNQLDATGSLRDDKGSTYADHSEISTETQVDSEETAAQHTTENGAAENVPVDTAAQAVDGNNDDDDEAQEPEEHGLLPRFFQQVQAWVLEKMGNEDDEDDADNDDWGEARAGNNNQAGNAPAPMAGNAPAAPGPMADVGLMNELGLDADVQANDMAGEEFDGILEAMGIRGPIGLLFQNAALMALVVVLALASTAWMPYIVGKTFVLMRPIDYLTLPLRILRYITDPIVDITLDVWLPFCWRVCLFLSRPIYWVLDIVFGSVLRVLSLVFDMMPESLWTFYTFKTGGTSPADQVVGNIFSGDTADNWISWLVAYMGKIVDAVNTATESIVDAFINHVADNGSQTVASTAGQVNATTVGDSMNFVAILGTLLGDANHETITRLYERWEAFAYGNSSADNFLSVAIGYIIIGISLVMYLVSAHASSQAYTLE